MTPALRAICDELREPPAELMEEARRIRAGLVFSHHTALGADQYGEVIDSHLKQMKETIDFSENILRALHEVSLVSSRSAVITVSANITELLRAISSLVRDYSWLVSVRPPEQLRETHELILLSVGHEVFRLDGVTNALERASTENDSSDWEGLARPLFGPGLVSKAALDAFQTASTTRKARCFIATASFDSPDDSRVLVFRRFRDQHLSTHALGRLSMSWYYRASPPIARVIARHTVFRAATRMLLAPLARFVLGGIIMAAYYSCRGRASRLQSHLGRMGWNAEEKPVQDQAVATGRADAAEARPEIYVAIFCRPPGQDDPACRRGVVQRRDRRRALGRTRRGQSLAQTLLP